MKVNLVASLLLYYNFKMQQGEFQVVLQSCCNCVQLKPLDLPNLTFPLHVVPTEAVK